MRAGLPTTLRVAPEDQLPRLLPIHWMQNIMLPTEPLYLVDGMIPRAGLSFIYGPPGSGKSFLALHLAACVALGRKWFGRSCERGAVLVLALEGAAGVRTRLVAAKMFDNELGNAPIALIDELIQIRGSDVDLAALLRAIETMRADLHGTGLELRLIVIDTYARAMGAADENSSSDMGEMLNIVETIGRVSGAAIVALAHPGKNLSSGLRGHSSMLAACDAAWEVKPLGEGQRSFQCVKNKDGPSDLSFWFALEQLSLDEFGKRTSCRVVEGASRSAHSSHELTNATDRQIVRELFDMRQTHGRPAGEWSAEAVMGFVVKRKDLMAELRTKRPERATPASWSKQVGRRLDAMKYAGRINEVEHEGERWLWLTRDVTTLLGLE